MDEDKWISEKAKEEDGAMVNAGKLGARVKELEEELEAHAWKISPAMAQAKIDELNRQVDVLRKALTLAESYLFSDRIPTDALEQIKQAIRLASR
jgi:predicted RNase H-like nuclease